MDEKFKIMEKEGKNTVENIVKLLKESKLIEDACKMQNLLDEANSTALINAAKFEEILIKVSKDCDKTVQECTRVLCEAADRLCQAMSQSTSK